MTAFKIADNSLDFDSKDNSESPSVKKKKEEPATWLNIYIDKKKTALTEEFKKSYDAIHKQGYKVSDIRRKYKVSKVTAAALELETMPI